MVSPIHPNEFALRQEVLFRQTEDPEWREGVITAVSVDDRRSRERHGDGCDEHLYVIADHAYDQLLPEDRRGYAVTGCLCEVMVADADSTGRWHGQRLGGGKGLALLLVDMERRGSYVELQGVVDDDGKDDRVMLLEVPGYHHLATAALDDLVAWASGIPATRWKEPIECE